MGGTTLTTPIPLWGAGLLANAVGQLASVSNVPTSFRASPLPQRDGGAAHFRIPTDLCGSGLAREGGGSACISIECADVFPGKPTPTGGRGGRTFSNTHRSLWERACSRRRWVSLHQYRSADVFAGKPAPTRFHETYWMSSGLTITQFLSAVTASPSLAWAAACLAIIPFIWVMYLSLRLTHR